MLQKALQKVLDNGDADFEIRSYSGRGMYGKSCLAIVSNDLKLLTLGILIGEVAADIDAEGDLVYQAENMKQDSMGLGTVYYWPRVQFVGQADEEEGDDE